MSFAAPELHSVVTTSELKPNANKEAASTTPVSVPTTANVTPHSQLSVGNHLEIPSGNNPNLLSPDILNQRRGKNVFLL